MLIISSAFFQQPEAPLFHLFGIVWDGKISLKLCSNQKVATKHKRREIIVEYIKNFREETEDGEGFKALSKEKKVIEKLER